jgi:GNAT superfamily N-acetyltransferase
MREHTGGIMSTEDISIRKASPSDCDRLSDLLTELFFIETDFVIDGTKHAKGISMIIDGDDRSVMFVAEHEGRIVGMVSGQIVISTAEGAASLLLEDMVVTGEFRRSGIGSALFRELLSWAKDKGAKRIQLVADRENNPALMFYKKQGFRQSRMTGMYKGI